MHQSRAQTVSVLLLVICVAIARLVVATFLPEPDTGGADDNVGRFCGFRRCRLALGLLPMDQSMVLPAPAFAGS